MASTREAPASVIMFAVSLAAMLSLQQTTESSVLTAHIALLSVLRNRE